MSFPTPFPLSRALLEAVLADRTTDRFVCELVWQRLGYAPAAAPAAPAAPAEAAEATEAAEPGEAAEAGGPSRTDAAEDGSRDRAPWSAGPLTPPDWAAAFPEAPPLIATRPASVRLTRSIPAEHKQLLKQQLGFAGYRIGELYPRRTRRATAVNWLLADLARRREPLPDTGPLPDLLDPPQDPVAGHPGDPPVT